MVGDGARVTGAPGLGVVPQLQRRVFAFLKEHEIATAADIAAALDVGAFSIEEALEGLRGLGLADYDHVSGSEAGSGSQATYALSGRGRELHALTDDPNVGYADGVGMESGVRDASASATGNVELEGARQVSEATVLDLLDDGLAAARRAAWSKITGSAQPTLGDIQVWLERVNRAVRAEGAPGHLGSFGANARFAAGLRLLLQGLGDYRLADPRTGLPGVLYHRRVRGCPAGRFAIKVHTEEGKVEYGEQSVTLPLLRLHTGNKPKS